MTAHVVDASAMLVWCFEDERPADADALLDRLADGGLHAPTHWALELTNILCLSERRGRISSAETLAFLSLVEGLDVQIDQETTRRAWTETRALAVAEGLTTYDAAYLELAIRRQTALASKDESLLAAAQRRGVPTLDLSVSDRRAVR